MPAATDTYVKTTPVTALQLVRDNHARLRALDRLFIVRIGGEDERRFDDWHEPQPGDVVIWTDHQGTGAYVEISVWTTEHQDAPFRGEPGDWLMMQGDRYICSAEKFAATYAAWPPPVPAVQLFDAACQHDLDNERQQPEDLPVITAAQRDYILSRVRSSLSVVSQNAALELRDAVRMLRRGMDGHGSQMSSEGRAYFAHEIAVIESVADHIDPA